jgi:branched-chain amino acid transport system permease protein
MSFIASQVFNGVAYGMLLFLLSAGLTLILGMMNVVNLAHAAFYLFASYVGYSVARATDNFLLAVVAGCLAGLVIGLIAERLLTGKLLGDAQRQVLMSVGIALLLGDMSLLIWGGDPLSIPGPQFLSGSADLELLSVPFYRVFIIVVGAVLFVGGDAVLSRTRAGAIIRASVDNQGMARAMGIDIKKVFLVTFGVGALLAGLAGVIGGAFLGISPGLDWDLLPLTLVVVIVGGVGSLRGALVASLLLGLLNNIGQALFPDFSYFTLFVPMIVILALRPSGLLPRR